MRLPRWYKVQVLFWMVVIAPFWWFAAAFNGYSFFSLPLLASQAEGEGWQMTLIFQLIVFAAMASPAVLLPFALLHRSRVRNSKNNHAPN